MSKKRKRQRVLSMIMSVLLLFSSFATDIGLGASRVYAADGEEMPEVLGDGDDGTYVLNASDASKAESGEWSGVPSYFTMGSDLVIQANSKKFTVDDAELTITNRIKTGSATFSTGRAIAFTVAEGKKATVTVCAVSGSSEGDAVLGIYDSDTATAPAQKAQLVSGNTPTSVFEEVEAGTYYLGSYADPDVTNVKSVNFYYVRVVEEAATPEEPSYGTATWDFQNKTTDLSTVEGTTAAVSTNSTTLSADLSKLTVDATSGKLAQRDSDAQFNSGAKISVPLGVGKNTVTVVSYPGYHNYTVDGTAADADTVSVTKVTTEEGGSVDIIATESAYLYSISLTVEEAPADVEVTVNIAEGDYTGETIVFTPAAGDAVEATNGAAVTLANGTEYALSVKDKADTLKALVNGEESFTPTEAGSITVDVQARTLNATATLSLTSGELSSGSSIYVTDVTASGAAVAVSVNGTFAIDYLHEYSVSTDAAKTKVLVDAANSTKITANDDQSGFTVTEEGDAAVAVILKSTVVNATINFAAADGVTLPADLTVTLTPSNTANATLENVKNGDSVELVIGESYSVTPSTNEYPCSTTVKAAEGTTSYTLSFSKADVSVHKLEIWDFGAADLSDRTSISFGDFVYGNAQITNMIVNDAANNASAEQAAAGIVTVKDINDQYGDVAGGTKSTNIPAEGLTFGDISFDAANTAKHRYRTTNESITRWDNKSLKDPSGEVHTGYLYSNASSSKDVRMVINAQAGDIYTFYVGSNSGAASYEWANADGVVEAYGAFTAAVKTEPNTFYAKSTGTYYLYCTNEKMVVSRIIRERPEQVAVSGKVSNGPETYAEGKSLVFTAYAESDAEMQNPLMSYEMALGSDGSFSGSLPVMYNYQLSLGGITTYIVASVTMDGSTTEGTISLPNGSAAKTLAVNLVAVDLVTMTGTLRTESNTEADNAALAAYMEQYAPEIKLANTAKIYQPEFEYLGDLKFEVVLEKGVSYDLSVSGMDDYTLITSTLSADANVNNGVIEFKMKDKAAVNVVLADADKFDFATDSVAAGGTLTAAAAGVEKVTFNLITVESEKAVASTYTYEYAAADLGSVKLRPGQYQVVVTMKADAAYVQDLTRDVKIADEAVTLNIPFKSTSYDVVAYAETLQVGSDKEYKTINDALAAVRAMERTDEQRVTIAIDPGDYQEMLRVDEANVTLKNAAATPSIALTNGGVGIDANAVRITSYYGVGYDYYSMSNGYLYDEAAFAVNTANGYPSMSNPTGGGTADMWNATVWVSASGFEAEGIIFENSFNQYVSELAAADTLVNQAGAKEAKGAPRSGLAAGSTAVQQKSYVERAAAFATGNGLSDVILTNCAVISHQDSLYGGSGTHVEFEDCAIYGGTDYIFGPMNGVFKNCELVSNTNSSDKNGNDVAYITAAQQSTAPGYLFSGCTIRNVVAGTEMDAAYHTAGSENKTYFGRPWGGTPQVLFYNTTIADGVVFDEGGWNDSLGGKIGSMMEYGTVSANGTAVDTSKRVDWAIVFPMTEEGAKAICNTLGINYTSVTTGRVLNAEKLDFAIRNYFKDSSAPDVTGIYDINLGEGLYAAQTYADGILSVLSDMPYNSNGYVKGSKNPSPNGGAIPTIGTSLVFKTPAAETDVDGNQLIDRVTITARANGKVFYLVKDNGGEAEVIDTFTGSSTPDTLVYILDPGSTYYFYASGSNQEVSALKVEHRVVTREPWADVLDPVMVSAVVGDPANESLNNPSSIYVTVKGAVGDYGADKIELDMINSQGNVVETLYSIEDAYEEDEQVYTFTPTYSDVYTFVARLVREGEKSKTSKESDGVDFTLPIAAPTILTVTNKGLDSSKKAKLEVVWSAVDEAIRYELSISENSSGSDKTVYSTSTRATEVLAEGLPYVEGAENPVTVYITAVGSYTDEKGKVHEIFSQTSKAKINLNGLNQRTWGFAAYGSSVSSSKNKYSNAVVDDSGELTQVTVASTGGSGKIVPASTDGLAFYFTKIDPSTENFTLTADAHVDEWKYSNGQDGFGLMVSDRVGVNGNSTAFWTNSYQLLASKIGYNWSPVDGVTSATADSSSIFKYDMKLGVGYTAKENVTLSDVNAIANGTLSMPGSFTTVTETLDTCVPDYVMSQLYAAETISENSTPAQKCAAFAAYTNQESTGTDKNNLAYGEYNIVSNASNASSNTMGEFEALMKEDFKFQIQRNNTGYVMRYLENEATTEEADGVSVVSVNGLNYKVIGSKTIYDTDRNAMTKIDKSNIYLGFFASRNATVTFKNITLTTINPADDAEAVEREITTVAVSDSVESPTTSNSVDYLFQFKSNRDGALTVMNKDTKAIVAENLAITAGKVSSVAATLKEGKNNFEWTFVPAAGYQPSTYEVMASYETVSGSHSVSYQVLEGETIYVTPDAKASGAGTQEDPVDIYTAAAYAQAGQTISLAEGTYNLSRQLEIPFGNDGTANNVISMIGAGADKTILDFSSMTDAAAGFEMVGNYWHLKGFAVTGSYNGKDGIHLCGSYNVVELVNMYKNGNTGLQISRHGSFGRDLWPQYNTILNCTSYLNYDAGFEDADGFAAKLTCGEGNKFIGCVSAYNADDGWDLFAKVQTGSIGKVTIENCVAYKNGYLLGYMAADGSDYEVFTENNHASDKFGQTFEKAVEFEAGNGNGFKMGGDSMSGYHELRDSITFMNKANGITSNSCPDIQIYNCISYNNNSANLTLYTSNPGINTNYVVEGMLSFKDSKLASSYRGAADSFKLQGEQPLSKVYQVSDYYWNGSKSLVYDKSGKETTTGADIANWVVSTEFSDSGIDTANNIFAKRTEKGGIDLGNFLKLTEEAKSGGELTDVTYEDVVTTTPELVVYAGSYTTLADMRSLLADLKDGWTKKYNFKYPNTKVAEFAGTAAELEVVDEEGKDAGYVKVDFVQISGVSLSMPEGVSRLTTEPIELTAAAVMSPAADLNAMKGASVTYTFSESSKLGLDVKGSGNTATVSRNASSKEGTAKVSVTMSVAPAAGKAVSKSATVSFATMAEDFSFSYTVSGNAVDRTEGGSGNYADGIVVSKSGDSFKLQDVKLIVGDSSSTDVTISMAKNTSLKQSGESFTALSADGVAVITLAKKGDKNVFVEIPVYVQVENRPFMANVDDMILDINRTDAVQFQLNNIYGGDDASAVKVAGVYRDAKLSKQMSSYEGFFDVTHVLGSVYTITLNDKAVTGNMATGNYYLKLQATTDGENYSDAVPMKVKIVKTVPSVKFTQKTAVNLFYNRGVDDGYGLINTSLKNTDGITLTQVNADTDYFRLDENGSGYDVVLVKEAASGSTLKAFTSLVKKNSKVVVTVHFDGYKDVCTNFQDKQFTIKVKTVAKAPKLAAEVNNSVFYEALSIKSTAVRFIDKTTKNYVEGASVELAEGKYAKTNAAFRLDDSGSELTLVLLTGKSATAKFSVKDADWFEPIIVSQSIKYSKAKPSVKIAKATLASGSSFIGNEKAAALITVKNASDFTIRDLIDDEGNIQMSGNAKAMNLLKYLEFDVETLEDANGNEAQYLTVRFGDDVKASVAAGLVGSYSFKATLTANKVSGLTANFKLQILPENKVTITTKASGKINVIDRTNSSVVLTPTMKNLNGKIVGVHFGEEATSSKTSGTYGANSLFDVEWDSSTGKAIVTANDIVDLKKGKYVVMPIYEVQIDGDVVDVAAAKSVNIVTVQNKAKVDKLSTMNVSASAKSIGSQIINVTSPKAAELVTVNQTSELNNFVLSYDSTSGRLSAELADTASVKIGKTYTVKALLVFEGQASNVKAQQISVKVKVTK